jgi:hypothetical protein
MTKDEALRMALDALEGFIPYLPLKDETQCNRYDKAITAIKAALEAKDEPVAWISPTELLVMRGNALGGAKDWRVNVGLKPEDGDVGLYTTPSQRTWVGLTDEEIEVIEVLRAPPVHPDFVDCDDWVEFARAIENKLRELNT